MNNNLIGKILIMLVILLIIITIIILIIRFNNRSGLTEDGEDVVENYGKNLNGGIDYSSYFDIKNCMQKYLNNINMNSSQYISYDENGNKVQLLKENEIKQKIFDLLSDKYISEKNVSVENIYNYIKPLQKQCIFTLVEASLIQDGDVKNFLTYGLIQSAEDYSLISKIYAVVNINIVDEYFSIEPISGEYNSIQEIKIEKLEDKITANSENKFSMNLPTADQFPVEYVNRFKQLALGAPEKLYELLDEKYRNAKFGSLSEFENYIKNNKSKIQTARLDSYKVDVDENEVRYTCIDQNGKYYIINQKEILQDYTMMLDTYTIDIPEFIEKYDNSESKIRVGLNIKKLIEALKNEDYKYIYNKLDENFKNNKFSTQASFESFIKGRFDPVNDTIKYDKYENKGGVHIYNITVTRKKQNKTVNAKIVMDLKKDRDFVFSFSTEE